MQIFESNSLISLSIWAYCTYIHISTNKIGENGMEIGMNTSPHKHFNVDNLFNLYCEICLIILMRGIQLNAFFLKFKLSNSHNL